MQTFSKQYQTEQDKFWAGQFGDEYSDRNQGGEIIASNTALFARIFSNTHSVRTLIEFGANIGLNLIAIRNLLPDIELSAVEINKKAVQQLQQLEGINVSQGSINDFQPDTTKDFVLTKGVLIHINPDMLLNVYNTLYNTSHRYICLAEYYNPTPVEVNYRGYKGRLFKRDFAGEMLDQFSNLQLVDYGFVYHRDINFRQDDMTWFLLEKKV